MSSYCIVFTCIYVRPCTKIPVFGSSLIYKFCPAWLEFAAFMSEEVEELRKAECERLPLVLA